MISRRHLLVAGLLQQLAREGMTMLMATHDLRLAASVASNVVFLSSGQVVESGPSAQLFQNPVDPRTRTFVSSLSQATALTPLGSAA